MLEKSSALGNRADTVLKEMTDERVLYLSSAEYTGRILLITVMSQQQRLKPANRQIHYFLQQNLLCAVTDRSALV